MNTPVQRKTRATVAQARLRAAAEHIENAQHELERAMSALGSLRMMHPEQQRVSALRDRLHAQFYRISAISHSRAKACAKEALRCVRHVFDFLVEAVRLSVIEDVKALIPEYSELSHEPDKYRGGRRRYTSRINLPVCVVLELLVTRRDAL